jgi:hypothetical protein
MTQTAVMAFLAALAGREPIETHISAVFVGPDTVWKLKKAVRLPFLDFSALAARERFLRRELELNRPAAPGIYRDVVRIGRQADGTLALDQGEAVDWVLRMAPIPAADFLDAIAVKGGLDDRLLDRMGDCVAAMHARLPPATGVDSAASQARIARGNAQSARAAGLPGIDAWETQCLAAIEALSPWLAQRSADGFVRRCHGDLHLGNLCLWQGAPVPFDALEFDEALATIDTAYDLAFLLMDLDLRANRQAANRVMNRYVARTGDAALVRGLGLFLSQRAMIRAHVSAAMGQPERAQRHLAAASAYLAPRPAQVIAIGGLQGTGKSTLARALAPALGSAPGALVVRSDETRKRLAGKAPEERLHAPAYTPEANERVNRALIEAVKAAQGHTVIADSTFLDPALRASLAQACPGFAGFWLQAPLQVLEDRVAARRNDASDATVSVLRRSADRDNGAPEGWTAVDATDLPDATLAVRRALATPPA